MSELLTQIFNAIETQDSVSFHGFMCGVVLQRGYLIYPPHWGQWELNSCESLDFVALSSYFSSFAIVDSGANRMLPSIGVVFSRNTA